MKVTTVFEKNRQESLSARGYKKRPSPPYHDRPLRPLPNIETIGGQINKLAPARFLKRLLNRQSRYSPTDRSKHPRV